MRVDPRGRPHASSPSPPQGFASIVFMVAGFDATPLLLVLFLGLKTYVDVRMHLGKHGGWGAIGGETESAGEKPA